jgi:hypothetical protein
MNVEVIVAAFLNHPTITALVGNRRALYQLPQNSAMPAIVYNIIDNIPQPVVNFSEGPQMARARVQINVLANTIAEVKNIHAAIRARMDFKHHQTVANKLVVSSRIDIMGPMDRDENTGVFNQPTDYFVMYYE